MSEASSFPRLVSRPCTVETLLTATASATAHARGNLRIWVKSVAAPEHASPGSLTFVQSDAALARTTAASVVVTIASCLPPSSSQSDEPDRCWIVVPDPRRWFVTALQSLFPAPEPAISATAVIAASAQIGSGVSIGPYCVIGENTVIGDRTRLGSHVTIHGRCRIGAGCTIHDHTTIGVSGFAYHRDADDSWYGLPHLGIAIVGDRVDIGAHCVIVRGILYDTVIENGVKIGNLVNIGHNVIIGENCWITGGATVCGRVSIERDVQIAAGAAIRDKITIGEGARIGLGTVVTKDVPAGASLFGIPGQPLRTMGKIA